MVIEATIAGANYSTLSTDRQPGPDDEFQSIGDTLGDVDPGLDKVLDVATARPLIAALPGTATNRPYPPILRRYDPKPIAERMGYSQMHISRLLAKALDTLRINPSFSRLAEPRGSGGPPRATSPPASNVSNTSRRLSNSNVAPHLSAFR